MLQMKEAQNNTNQRSVPSRTNISTLTNQTGAFKDNGTLRQKKGLHMVCSIKSMKGKK